MYKPSAEELKLAEAACREVEVGNILPFVDRVLDALKKEIVSSYNKTELSYKKVRPAGFKDAASRAIVLNKAIQHGALNAYVEAAESVLKIVGDSAEVLLILQRMHNDLNMTKRYLSEVMLEVLAKEDNNG